MSPRVPLVSFLLTAVFGAGFAFRLAQDGTSSPAQPTQAPEPAVLIVQDPALARLQSLGQVLVGCRVAAAEKVCEAAGRASMACITARRAITADGVFGWVRALGDSRADQLQMVTSALNRCLGGREDDELDALLAAPLAVRQ